MVDQPKRYVLYHANCPDGFGAAWAAHRKFGDDGTVYKPVAYGYPPPAIEPGAEVLIVDFSYPREQLLKLAESHLVIVLDHHATAQADLEGLDFCTFDMDRSGAMLTWQHLFPLQEAPALIKYVQDRDLWRFELPNSKVISAWLMSYPFDFDGWNRLSQELAMGSHQVVAEGEALLRLKSQYVESMCRHPAWVELGGHKVPAANATVCFSEVGDLLCERYPNAPFAAYWTDRSDGLRQWGLRSRGGFDVSEVAKRYGGGGHKAASGFTVPLGTVQP